MVVSDDEVKTAIDVLKHYVAGELALDNDLLDALEQAIEAAFNAMTDDGPDNGDYETPLTCMW